MAVTYNLNHCVSLMVRGSKCNKPRVSKIPSLALITINVFVRHQIVMYTLYHAKYKYT